MTLDDFYKLEKLVIKQYYEVKSASTIPAIQERLAKNENNLLNAIKTVRELAIHNGMIGREENA